MASTAVRKETAGIIRAMDAEFVRNVAAGDAEALVNAFYAEDAEVLPPHAPLLSGREAILAFWKGGLLAAGAQVSLDTRRIEESGDLAYGSGVYTLTMPAPGGGTTTDKGKYVVVYRRQANGEWRAVADIFNSDQVAG